MGKPVVVGLDDAYWMLPYSNPARRFWFDKDHPTPEGEVIKGGATKMLEEGLRQADGLIAPNRLLLKDYEHITKNSYYLQNYAEEKWWVDLPNPVKGRAKITKEEEEVKFEIDPVPEWEDKIILGWGGSISHLDSWFGSQIFEAIKRVTERHKNLLWLICGNDERIYRHLPVSNQNKAHQGGVPAEYWPQVVNMFDIGLAPLFDIYDQRRSWIKGIEYSLAGMPWVAIEGETYSGLSDWPLGFQGPETVEFWENTLEDIIKNLDKYTEQARELVPQARDRFLATRNLDVFATVYGQILQDFKDVREGLPSVFKVNELGKKDNGKEKDIKPLENVIKISRQRQGDYLI